MNKYVNGLDDINVERIPMVNTPKDVVLTRSNVVKIRREAFKSKIRNDFAKTSIIFSSTELHQFGCFTRKDCSSSNSKHV